MSIQIGSPGNSARWHSLVQLVGVPLFVAVAWVLAAPLLFWSMSRLSLGLRFVVFALGLLIGLFFARKDIRWFYEEIREGLNYAKGADGELRTAEALASLPDQYVVIHDFHPLGKDGEPADWNVDHIVVGSNGVFVLDTKNYSSPKVLPARVSAITEKNVKQADRNALQLKNSLKAWSAGALSDVFVVPMLVYVHPQAFVDKLQEGRVKVLPLKYLVGDIMRNSPKRKLQSEEVLRISSVLLSQMAPHLQAEYRSELRRFGSLVRPPEG